MYAREKSERKKHQNGNSSFHNEIIDGCFSY